MAPPISVRRLREDDAAFLVASCSLPHCRGLVHPPTIEQVLAGFGSTDATSYVVEAQGRRVGIVRIGMAGEPTWLVELRLVVITEPRKGYGSAAIAWAQRLAFERIGAHRLYLEVVARNLPARALYERCGFTLEGVWRDGFREDDGTYRDLAAYGMLDREYVRPS